MSKIRNIFSALILIGIGLFSYLVFSQNSSSKPAQVASSYPAPENSGLGEKKQEGYPAPEKPVVKEPVQMPPTREFISPAEAEKLEKTAAAHYSATVEVMQAKSPIRKLEPVKISSESDLPEVMYQYYAGKYSNDEVSLCLLARTPGDAVFVKSLGNQSDYYLLPFYREGKLCGVANIGVQDGIGTYRLFEISKDNVFLIPQISAKEAIQEFQKKISKKVIGQPFLACKKFRLSPICHKPFWVIKTEDGETYFVVTPGPYSNGKENLIIVNENEAD